MKYVRKLTPVSQYSLAEVESWLQDLAAQGLFLETFRPLFCTFRRGTPSAVRYRVEYCKKANRDGPPKDLTELYRAFGWDFVCSAAPPSLLIFCTENPLAEEPHTDPITQGELLNQLARSRRLNFLGNLFVLLLAMAALLCVTWSAPVLKLTTDNRVLALLLYGIYALSLLPRSILELHQSTQMVQRLRSGMSLPHRVSYPNHARRILANFLAAVLLLILLIIAQFSNLLWNTESYSISEVRDFSPLSLSELEDCAVSHEFAWRNRSFLCWTQWQVIQTCSSGEGEPPHLELDWYQPLFPALADPMAEELLQTVLHSDSLWWPAPEEAQEPWILTAYDLPGLDRCVVAELPDRSLQAAVLAGDGRAALVRYAGTGALKDHLDAISSMVHG